MSTDRANPTDEDTKLLKAFMRKAHREELRCYVERGRIFQHSSERQLKDGFVRAMKAVRLHGYANLRQTLTDLGSELELRGLEPPYDELRPHLDVMLIRTLAEGQDREAAERQRQAIAAFKREFKAGMNWRPRGFPARQTGEEDCFSASPGAPTRTSMRAYRTRLSKGRAR